MDLLELLPPEWAARYQDAQVIDGRRLRCPLPALRLQRALQARTSAMPLVLVATDPATQQDIPALAREHGWSLLESSTADNLYFYIVA